jgi:hypothetical protein
MSNDPADPLTEDGEALPPTVKDLYLANLNALAESHGEDYARLTAAETMAHLWSLISAATYRLSGPFIVLPDTPEPGSDPD